MIPPSLRPFLALFLLAAFLFLAFLGTLPLTGADEARYATAAREMLQRHDWLIPTYNGNLRLNKPILFYWLLLLSYRLGEVSPSTARLPSAIMGLLLVLLLEWAWRRRGEPSPGPGAVAATMLAFFLLARLALTDMALTFFIAVTLLALWPLLERPEAPRFRWDLALGSGLAAAGAMLTKGPIGWVLPFLACLFFTLWEKRWRFWVRGELGLAFLLACALSAPWFLAIWRRVGPEPVLAFFHLENVQRYAETVGGHRGPIWYYLAVLWVATLPWSGFLALGGGKMGKRPSSEARLAASLLLAVLAFFSLSATKLPHYLAPALPAAAWLAAEGWHKEAMVGRQRGVWMALTALPLLLLSLLFVGLPELWNRFSPFPLEGTPGRFLLLRLGSFLPLGMLAWVLRQGMRGKALQGWGWPALSGFMLLGAWLEASLLLASLLAPWARLAQRAHELAGPQGRVWVVGLPVELADIATFYAQGTRVERRARLEALPSPGGAGVLVLTRCGPSTTGMQVLAQEGGWCLMALEVSPPAAKASPRAGPKDAPPLARGGRGAMPSPWALPP